MKLVDSNVWLALFAPGHPHYGSAQSFFAEPIAPGELLFCRATELSLLRLLTRPAVWKQYGNTALTWPAVTNW